MKCKPVLFRLGNAYAAACLTASEVLNGGEKGAQLVLDGSGFTKPLGN